METMPKAVLLIEQVISLWINNTPTWMQPKWVWLIYYKIIDSV
jgi:hypothetical protein